MFKKQLLKPAARPPHLQLVFIKDLDQINLDELSEALENKQKQFCQHHVLSKNQSSKITEKNIM